MPILSETFPAAPGGMNVAFPQQELDDTEARYIQDGLVDYPGLLRRRGPVRAVPNIAALTRKGTGLVMALNPQGKARIAALTGDAANGYLTIYSADRQSTVDLAWPHPLPTDPAAGASTAYRIVDAKAALTGGAWIGVSSAYDSDSPEQGLAYWQGATKANYTTGTISVSRGSAAVTGVGTVWAANAEPGMFLFANTDEGYTATLVGVVLSINSDTSLTLKQVSPYALTAKTYTLQSIRGFAPRVTSGRITSATDSTTVTGGATKFRAQGLGTGIWNLYRQTDLVFVGKVASVESDEALTLAANAAVAVKDEAYVAIRADADYAIETTANVNKVGFLNATYAERQWFLNNGAQFDKTFRLHFTDPNDPEAVDLTEDGDWIPISSTGEIQEGGRALAPAYNALVVLKENETFAVYGSSPETFAVKKLEDDGALSGMSVQLYGGGVLWAGREGVWFYNGITTDNLTQTKLGDVWKNSIGDFDSSRYRMWSMVIRNHYILHVESLDPTVPVVKGNVSSTPDRWTVVINMVTRAVTLMTKVNLRGAVQLPANESDAVWYLVNGRADGNSADVAKIVSADALFDEEGADSVVTDPGTTIVNRCPAPSFESSFAGAGWLSGVWNSNATTAERRNTWAKYGAWSAYVLGTATNNDISLFSGYVTAAAGEVWTVSCWVNLLQVTTQGIKVVIEFWDNAIRLSDSDQSALVTTLGVTRLSKTTAAAPAGTTRMRVRILQNTTGTQTAEWYTDGVQFEIAATATDYTDGDQPDGLWTGTAHASTTLRVVPGPDFFLESKKFEAGDALRLKKFKQLALHYLVQGDDIQVDTVVGLNNVGQQMTSTFPASVYTWSTLPGTLSTWSALGAEFASWSELIQAVLQPKRVKFQKGSTHLSFRLYQKSGAVTRLKVGPYQIGYKLKRPGRVS